MIRKTMTIISIAILVAAISVATTMTMIQADTEASGLVATFGPNGGTDGVTLNPELFIAMNHDYSDVTGSVDDAFTNSLSLPGGYLDAMEPTFQVDGLTVPTPDGSFSLFFGGALVAGPLDFIKGHEEATFDFDSLNADSLYEVTVDISDMDDVSFQTSLWLDAGSSVPALETVFVTANTVELGSIVADVGALTGALKTKTFSSQVERANGAGDLKVGFNQLFVWDPVDAPFGFFPCGNPVASPLGCPGTESGIRVEQITLVEKTGVITKTDTCPDEIEIREVAATSCTFTIIYTGDSANIRDTVPAEWDVTGIVNSNVDAELTFEDDTGIGNNDDVIDDITELVVTEEGTNVPNGVFTFPSDNTDAIVTFTDANGDKKVQIGELVITNPGTAIVADATITLASDEQCESVVKGNSGKGATKINCDNVREVDATVFISTRESPDTKKHPNKAHKFKPTSCVPLAINDGAVAILVDSNGDVVLTGDPALPAILDETPALDPIVVIANEGLEFECED